ncbi:hypothetical protein FACS1894133_4830 [Clostridia bacterium]|nr:hypothetical protein FACS1894133_4830 [Clostridia bacterium]
MFRRTVIIICGVLWGILAVSAAFGQSRVVTPWLCFCGGGVALACAVRHARGRAWRDVIMCGVIAAALALFGASFLFTG